MSTIVLPVEVTALCHKQRAHLKTWLKNAVVEFERAESDALSHRSNLEEKIVVAEYELTQARARLAILRPLVDVVEALDESATEAAS